MTNISHPWKVSFQEAVKIQKKLAHRIRRRTSVPLRRRLSDPDLLVAGADISFNRQAPYLFAAVVIMRLGDLSVVERVGLRHQVNFPYVPGFLSFREVPPILAAWRELKRQPDVLLCDGQGIAHPRRLGLAAHLGLLLDLPAIGCAKSRLIGRYREPGWRKGSASRLSDGPEIIGRVLRTRSGVKPLYISIGHRIGLEDAVSLVLRCCPRYRIPEPTREAHMTVNRLRECLG
jgi:deoxyribonuclease V